MVPLQGRNDKPKTKMKTTAATIQETNISKLVETNRNGVAYEEKYACGWMSDMDKPSARLVTIAAKHPTATIVVFGDETIGIEIEGKLWAVEQPHDLRGCERTIPHEDWRWLHWASCHGIDNGVDMVSFGDRHDLRKIW